MKIPVSVCSLMIGFLVSTTALAQDGGTVDAQSFLSRLRAELSKVKDAYGNARVKGVFTVTNHRQAGLRKDQYALELLQQGRNLKLNSTERMGERVGVEDLFVWTPQLGFMAVKRSPDQVGRSLKGLVRTPGVAEPKKAAPPGAAKAPPTPSEGERLHDAIRNRSRFLRGAYSYLEADLDEFLSQEGLAIREVKEETVDGEKRTKVSFDTKGADGSSQFYEDGWFLLDPLKHLVLHSGIVTRHTIEEGKDYTFEITLNLKYNKEVEGIPLLSHVRYEGKTYEGVVSEIYDVDVTSIEFDPPVSEEAFTLKGNDIDFDPGVEPTSKRKLPQLFYWSTAATLVLIILLAVLRRSRADTRDKPQAA